MKTFNRICIKDYSITDDNGKELMVIRRAKEYLTSAERDGQVTVLSTYWAEVPVNIFAGDQPFTT